MTQTEVKIDCDFPGGNIIVKKVDGDHVYIQQDALDTDGDWFFWHFRVREAVGKTLTFHFVVRDDVTGSVVSVDGGKTWKGPHVMKTVLGVRGPAVSLDGGKTWGWMGAEHGKTGTFQFSFPAGANDVRFCMSIPYLETNLREFLNRHSANTNLKVEQLCRTPKGRGVEMLRAGRLDGNCIHRVLLTCRHHCSESTASFVLEGMLDAILSDNETGKWFQQTVEVLVVPFMDKDGVEDGDQGKNRRPFDHCRDYKGESIYAEVAALRKFVPAWSQERLHVSLDLHCPELRAERIYFVGQENQDEWKETCRFSDILATHARGLPFTSKNNLPFGEQWNVHRIYKPEPPKPLSACSPWVATLPGIRLATSLEIPYATANGAEVNPQSLRAFGADLAAAVAAYIQTSR